MLHSNDVWTVGDWDDIETSLLDEIANGRFEMQQQKTRYYYRDFEDRNKKHFTGGKFIGWQRGGMLGVIGAVFQLQSSALFIPKYLLCPETLAVLPEVSISE